MSLIKEFRETQAAIKELQDRLTSMRDDSRLKKDLDLLDDLDLLLEKHDRTRNYLIALLKPSSGLEEISKKSERAPRKTKRYKNPYTGEVIDTKGGNNKNLKAWKAQYPDDDVETWVTILG